MKKRSTNKDFKAVEFMRGRRDELSALYTQHPKEFWKRLEIIGKKYKGKFHHKEKNAA